MTARFRCLHPAVLRFAASAALVISLAACANVVTPDPNQAILIEPERNVLLLHAGARGGISGTDVRRLSDFLNTSSQGKLDAVHVTIIGPNAAARAHAARLARRYGVPVSKIREVAAFADDRSRFMLRIEAMRFEALPPVCPALEVTGPSFDPNDFEPTNGCSTRANLAANINDPAELLRNNARPASDGARAAAPVGRWRDGEAPRLPATPTSQTSGTPLPTQQ
jgi:pilus biogenesis lipoprotein CpaD